MNSWNEAAATELAYIYIRPASFGDINRLRKHLDRMIDDYLGETPTFDAEGCRSRWIELGRLARDLGSGIGYSNFFESSGGLLEVLVRKQRDYGHHNIARFGRLGLLVRVHDKIARLENLLASGAEPNNESILDNVIDVVGYSTIGAMWERGNFMLALQPHTVVETIVVARPHLRAPHPMG